MVLGVIHLGYSWLISLSTQSHDSPGGASWIVFKKIWSLTAHLLYILKHTHTLVYTQAQLHVWMHRPAAGQMLHAVVCGCCPIFSARFWVQSCKQTSLPWAWFLRRKKSVYSKVIIAYLCKAIGHAWPKYCTCKCNVTIYSLI